MTETTYSDFHAPYEPTEEERRAIARECPAMEVAYSRWLDYRPTPSIEGMRYGAGLVVWPGYPHRWKALAILHNDACNLPAAMDVIRAGCSYDHADEMLKYYEVRHRFVGHPSDDELYPDHPLYQAVCCAMHALDLPPGGQ
jgi:hypothetical protein